MMKAVRNVLMLAVVLAIAGPLMAAERPRPKGEKPARPRAREGFSVLPKQLLEGIELTAEQKAKVEELQKEMAPKLKEAREKMEGILTDEQKKARAEAEKAARAAGKERKEIREAVEAAVQLTDEQKAKQAEARKAMGELFKEAREKFMALLTPEQQKVVKDRMKKARGEGRKHEEKKAEAEKK